MRRLSVLVSMTVFISACNNLSEPCFSDAELNQISRFSDRLTKAKQSAVFVWVEGEIVFENMLTGEQYREPLSTRGKGIIVRDRGIVRFATIGHLVIAPINDARRRLMFEKRTPFLRMVESHPKIFIGTSGRRNQAQEVSIERIENTSLSPGGNKEGYIIARLPVGFDRTRSLPMINSFQCIRDQTKVWIIGGEVQEESPLPYIQVLENNVSISEAEDYFELEDPVYPGTSGSGVIGFRSGAFAVTGLVSELTIFSRYGDNVPIRAMVYRIDPVIDYFQKTYFSPRMRPDGCFDGPFFICSYK